MNLSRREFLQVLAAASAAGMALGRHDEADAQAAQQGLYDLPPFGNVSLLHMTDCHAQLLPIRFREPSVNLGVGGMAGQLPHLVGEHLLKAAKIPAGTPQAHAFTYLDFEQASRRYGKVGGFAHLATLVKQLKASRPGALLLDGGDTWQGSATSLWTNAQDMVDACKALGVDVMTGHWEFTYGMERVKEIVDKDFKGAVDFVAQNVRTTDFEDPVFRPYVIRPINGVPVAIPVRNAGGITLVTNAGSNGKFLGVMDFDVKGGKVADVRYRLLPVFSNMLKADPAMDALIRKVRAPYEAKLAETLAVTDGVLYRRGNFNGAWDQLIVDALMDVQGADLAFSPGFRWGTSLLPGDAITRELLMDQVAITYPYATLTEMTGETIKTILEDVADNLFNPDPYYQQGGDMVRVGGLEYAIAPAAGMGSRITDMRLKGRPIEADKRYRVAGWAPVAEEAKNAPGVKPVWDVVETWLKGRGGRVAARTLNTPRLIGVQGNPGIAA
jgi:2',3'-cyclic-nucleotide 2'-phosphodiesterase (5'-nucleotidase family)